MQNVFSQDDQRYGMRAYITFVSPFSSLGNFQATERKIRSPTTELIILDTVDLHALRKRYSSMSADEKVK